MPDASIIASFGGDTTDLKRASEEAGVIVKGFGRQASLAFREIGQGFAGAVIFTELIRGFKDLAEEAVTDAEKTRDSLEKMGEPIPYQVAALASLGDAFKSTKEIGVDFVGSILVHLSEVGGEIANFIADVRGMGEEEAQANQKISESAERTITTIAAARKKYIEELPAKEAEAEKQLADLRAKNAAAQQSAATNLADATARVAQIDEDISNTLDGTLRQTQLRVEREKAVGDQIKYQGQVTQEAAKQAEQFAKIEKERQDAMSKAIDEALSRLPDVTEEWVRQHYEAGELTKAQVTQLGYLPQMADWAKKIADDTAKAAEAAAKEAEARQKAADAAARQAASLNANGYGGGSQYGTASDATLQEIIQQNRRDQIAIATNPNGNGNGLGSDYAQALDQGRIDAANQELAFRTKLRSDAAVGGESYARSQFQGDPLQFEKIYQQIVGTAGGGLGANQKTQQDISDIADVLKSTLT